MSMTLLITNRSYRLLFSASAVSNLGDGVASLAFPWLATLITRDPGLIALVAFATRLPWLLFSIPVGVLIDRGDRRVLMIQADLFRLLMSLAVIALILTIRDFPVQAHEAMYAGGFALIAFLIGTAEVVRDNSAQTVLPSLVASADLEKANGQMWSVEQIAGSFIGPPLAGALIALAVPAPFTLNVIAFGLAAWLVWMIAMPPRLGATRRHIRIEIMEGWRWLRSRPMLLRLALMLSVMNFVWTMAATALVLYAQEILHLNALQYGTLLTAGAAGGVVCGVMGSRIIARLGPMRSVYLALLLMITPFLVLAFTSSIALAAISLFIEMIGSLLWNIVTVSYRQRLIPDALLGRVNALYRFFAWGTMPLGALAGGWIVSACEPGFGREMALRMPFFLATICSCGMFVYGRIRVRL